MYNQCSSFRVCSLNSNHSISMVVNTLDQCTHCIFKTGDIVYFCDNPLYVTGLEPSLSLHLFGCTVRADKLTNTYLIAFHFVIHFFACSFFNIVHKNVQRSNSKYPFHSSTKLMRWCISSNRLTCEVT